MIEPGSFGGGEEVTDDPYHGEGVDPTLKEMLDAAMPLTAEIVKPDSSQGKAVTMFVKRFGAPLNVLYSGCGLQVLRDIFPEADVVYVDPNKRAIEAIRLEIGPRALAAALKIEEYDEADRFDLLYLQNSYGPIEEHLKRAKKGGLVFCNNYFGAPNAEEIITHGSCTLLAVIERIPDTDGQEHALFTDGLEDYLAPHEHDEEHNHLPPRKKIAEYYVFRKD